MTPVSSQLPELLQAALRYGAAGFRVFPVHSAKGKRCSCPDAACDDPGKHPRIFDWGNLASSDASVIDSWWKKWPDSNIGLRTGNGIVAVDLDTKGNGEEAFSELVSTHGTLPVTPEQVTGSGGRHLLFSYNGEPIRNSVQGIASGVDVRGDGGLIVVAPSVHASTKQYEWASGRSPFDIPIAPIPPWLLAMIRAKMARRIGRLDPEEPIPDGKRDMVLTSMAGSMRTKGFDQEAILAALLATNSRRCNPPLDEVQVKKIATSVSRYKIGTYSGQVRPDGRPDREGRLSADGTPVAPPLVQQGSWEQELTYDKFGNVKGTVAGNAALLLANLPEWAGCLQFDAFNNRIDWTRSPPLVAGLGMPSGEFADHHVLYVQQWLARHRGVEFAKGHTQDAIISAARRNAVHPLQDYLNSLQWDGVPRLTRWLSTYIGAADTEYTRAVGTWWVISAIARGLKPGCQVDHMLILEGRQGCGKSTAVRILAGDWYLGTLPDLRDSARAADAIRGHWIGEWGELDAMRGAALTRTKDFITQPADTYRAAYARFKETHLRSVVFIGTTNEHNYLRDSTGARRYWPVLVILLKRDALIRDRDQLWAEAKYMYENGAQWHPTPELAELLEKEQEDRYEPDPWEEYIHVWLNDASVDADSRVLTGWVIADECLKIRAADCDQGVLNRVGRCMRRLGYQVTTMKDKDRKSYKAWRLSTPGTAEK